MTHRALILFQQHRYVWGPRLRLLGTRISGGDDFRRRDARRYRRPSGDHHRPNVTPIAAEW